MSGVKGKSGRKKVISTIVSEAIDRIREDLPELFQELKRKALAGDREAAIYLIDRAMGKPKQQTEIDLQGGELLGAGTVKALLEIVYRERQRLAEPDIKYIKEGSQGATE